MTASVRPHRVRRLVLVGAALVAVALATIAVPAVLERALAALDGATSPVDAVERVVRAPFAPVEPGVDDGALPGGPVSPWADVPAIANLDPELLAAVRAAADAAAADGVELVVNSGWRSAALQQAMLDDAIVTYGSEEEAARWVATPEESAHVTGDAVDVGWDGATWLGANGWTLGLCQPYANESWHFELRPDAPTDGCPAMLDDLTSAH